MVYHVNASIVAAAVIGFMCTIMEICAMAHDLIFNEKFEKNTKFILSAGCGIFKSPTTSNNSRSILLSNSTKQENQKNTTWGDKPSSLLKRNKVFEPIALSLLSLTVTLCIISLVITHFCWTQKNAKKALIMNKTVSCTVTLTFIASGILISYSLYVYDQNYFQFNNNRKVGCNIGEHHYTKEATSCDNAYKVCQREALKIAIAVMIFLCMCFGVSGTYTEFRSTPVEDAAKFNMVTDDQLRSSLVENKAEEPEVDGSIAEKSSTQLATKIDVEKSEETKDNNIGDTATKLTS